MMEHMLRVSRNPARSTALAKYRTPTYLAKAARIHEDGKYALESVIAQGHWIQINGHWYKREEVIG